MISRTRGTPMIEAITIMKTVGRLFSNIEFITVVALTALAPVMMAGGGAGVGLAAGIILEIFCKALVVFSSLSLTVADIAPAVTFVVVLLVNPPSVVVFLRSSVAFSTGEAEVVATATFSDNKVVMDNSDSDTRIIVVA